MNYNPFKNPDELPLRYLNSWDCVRGVPEYEPSNQPYQYNEGDYFIVKSTTPNGWNYIPNDSQYPGLVREVFQGEVKDLLVYEEGKWNTYTWDELSTKYHCGPTARIQWGH